MDFGQAALLVFVFVGLVAEAKALVWGSNKQRITVAIVNAVAIASVFLVAETVWGNDQIIGGQQLGLLDWASKLLIAVILGGGASGLWEGFTTLKNVGQNLPTVYDPKYGQPISSLPKTAEAPPAPPAH